jgi:cbb3-type cytochrome oxidase subunit 3
VTSGKTFFTIIFIFSSKLLIFMKCSKKCLLLILIAFLICTTAFLLSQTGKGEKERAIEACINLCKSKLNVINLSNGPCLSNEIIPNWVCDVAHWPRQDIDNREENQCEAYRKGLANHFVEVDENCNFIRAI